MPTSESSDENSNNVLAAARIKPLQGRRSESDIGISESTSDITAQDLHKSKKKNSKKDVKLSRKSNALAIKSQRKLTSGESMKSEYLKVQNDSESKKFKATYTSSVEKIFKDWVSVIYCILVLRINLIKFVIRKLPDNNEYDSPIPAQILLEGKTVYNMIQNAQHISQERFLHLWVELKKLLSNRIIIKRALDMAQSKESIIRDWKGADSKLSQLQEEYQQAQECYKSIQKAKIENESTLQKNFLKLQSLANARNAEYKHLVEQITELKKKEVQMRGKILVNMKNYKDLKMKRQSLCNVENEIYDLKNEQHELVKKYTAKIQSLKDRIEDIERQTKAEKEERRKLKANLEGFGDFVEKRSFASTDVN